MDPNRRYSEEEVSRILEDATEAQTHERYLPSARSGTSLAELREIALEVGIPVELIEQAASRLDRPAPAPLASPRFMGADIGVGRTVYLKRPLTDREWDQLVVDLRETFDARGQVRQVGNFREWTNGNLQALLEPTESGERLRLRTKKGSAIASMRAGAILMGVSALLMVLLFLTGQLATYAEVLGPAFMGLMGVGLFLSGRLGLSGWAATREAPMEEVAARLLAATEAES